MSQYKQPWLKELGPVECAGWIEQMKREGLSQVELMTPKRIDHSAMEVFSDYQLMVYTIEDFETAIASN